MENKILRSLYVLFPISFLLWLFAFRGFFTGELAFTSDAISYYNHIKFYVESLGQGVFPLWDPVWCAGVPNQFFLQRFGAYNPAYAFILILNKIGLPYMTAYLCFLAGYYWVGMIGFYKLARRLFNNSLVAFMAYLFLMFSSVGTRLFDSYLLLIIVPGLWFFYCLVGFAQTRKKSYFLGMSFTMMILASTYIPFYFLIILATFLFWFSLLYFKNSVMFLKYLGVFMKTNKGLVILCALAVVLSFMPGLLLTRESSSRTIVLPQRSASSTQASPFSVGLQTITSWGMLEDMAYSIPFLKDITTFKFAVVYVPPAIVLILILGLFTKITRQSLLLFCWGMSLFILFSPHAPVYRFLHQQVFFFKYFRNLHFFLWFALIPIFILFACAQIRDWRGGRHKAWLLWGVTLGVVAHPMCAYHYLSQNVKTSAPNYRYDRPYLDFSWINPRPQFSLYYATLGYQRFIQKVRPDLVRQYLRHKLVAYPSLPLTEDLNPPEVFQGNTPQFRVLHYDRNSLRLKTHFDEDKFIVYNDAFDQRWEAYINGKRVDIVQANIAFKGIHVPAGENEVFLRYGSLSLYVWNYVLLAVFYGMLGWTIWMSIKESVHKEATT